MKALILIATQLLLYLLLILIFSASPLVSFFSGTANSWLFSIGMVFLAGANIIALMQMAGKISINTGKIKGLLHDINHESGDIDQFELVIQRGKASNDAQPALDELEKLNIVSTDSYEKWANRIQFNSSTARLIHTLFTGIGAVGLIAGSIIQTKSIADASKNGTNVNPEVAIPSSMGYAIVGLSHFFIMIYFTLLYQETKSVKNSLEKLAASEDNLGRLYDARI